MIQDKRIRKYINAASGESNILSIELRNDFDFTALVKAWFPSIFELYTEVQIRYHLLEAVFDNFIFPGSCFCGTSLNGGPRALSKEHVDCRNLVAGICLIAAIGNFNHRTSAHLILREPKAILEVMDGDMVIIPSGSVTHSNSSLKEGEWRMSLVQYTSGALFRRLFYGGLAPSVTTKKEKDALDKVGMQRWLQCWGLFPTLADLLTAIETRKMPKKDVRGMIDRDECLVIRNIPLRT